jgi:hypothetical protein
MLVTDAEPVQCTPSPVTVLLNVPSFMLTLMLPCSCAAFITRSAARIPAPSLTATSPIQ